MFYVWNGCVLLKNGSSYLEEYSFVHRHPATLLGYRVDYVWLVRFVSIMRPFQYIIIKREWLLNSVDSALKYSRGYLSRYLIN